MSHVAKSAGILVVILVIAAAILGMQIGWFIITNNGEPGVQPNIPLLRNERFVHISRMRIGGSDYSLWDVRDNRTGLLKFMILVSPSNGKPVRDPQIQGRAFSLRLALQIAHVVNSMNEKAQGTEEKVSKIASLGGLAINMAEMAGQYSIARDLREFGASIGEKTQTALSLAATVQGSAEYADRLLKEPTEENADLFIASLGVSAAVTASQRAAYIYFLITNALPQMGVSPGAWLEDLYNRLTRGSNPTIVVLNGTFGAYEVSQTTMGLTERGVY